MSRAVPVVVMVVMRMPVVMMVAPVRPVVPRIPIPRVPSPWIPVPRVVIPSESVASVIPRIPPASPVECPCRHCRPDVIVRIPCIFERIVGNRDGTYVRIVEIYHCRFAFRNDYRVCLFIAEQINFGIFRAGYQVLDFLIGIFC